MITPRKINEEMVVKTERFKNGIELKKKNFVFESKLNDFSSYVKINVTNVKIIIGSYFLSHSKMLFNRKKIGRQGSTSSIGDFLFILKKSKTIRSFLFVY